jgi:hypothetical protein
MRRSAPSKFTKKMQMQNRLFGALGSFPDQEEFQVDRTIVNVVISPDNNRQYWINQANKIFDSIWNSIPEVLAVVEKQSRIESPYLWLSPEVQSVLSGRVCVFGIWLDPKTGIAEYHVEENEDYIEYLNVEGRSYMVKRELSGKLVLCSHS